MIQGVRIECAGSIWGDLSGTGGEDSRTLLHEEKPSERDREVYV